MISHFSGSRKEKEKGKERKGKRREFAFDIQTIKDKK